MINSLINSSMMIKTDPKNAQNMQHMMKLMSMQQNSQKICQNQNNGSSYLNYNTSTHNSELLQNPAFLNFLKNREQEKQMGQFNN